MKAAVVGDFTHPPNYRDFAPPVAQSGESVFINDATGSADRLAIQIAKYLGASRIVATGRNQAGLEGLASLGADVLIPLDQPSESLVASFRREIDGFRGGRLIDSEFLSNHLDGSAG
jgi:NADPH:quinone reductase-like Zn-dependent oxidoreductase